MPLFLSSFAKRRICCSTPQSEIRSSANVECPTSRICAVGPISCTARTLVPVPQSPRQLPVRCTKAQNPKIIRNSNLHKTKQIQQRISDPSHSPKIVPRGTIWQTPNSTRQPVSGRKPEPIFSRLSVTSTQQLASYTQPRRKRIIFDSDQNLDKQPGQFTRRSLIFGGATAAAALAVLSLRRSAGVHASGIGAAIHVTPGQVTIVNFSNDGKNLGEQTVAKIVKTDEEWLQQLGKNSYDIARQADTEIAYTGVSWNEHRPGIFRCICCETALFSSQTKFESGTGWPSFWAPIAKENVAQNSDSSLGMERTEVHCARCEAHLGHVFDDGPQPTGLRYCMNSASMHFINS